MTKSIFQKTLILALTPLLLASSYEPPSPQKSDSRTRSSASRGCPVPLPTLEIETNTLPKAVQFRLLASNQEYPIIMTIYPKNGRGEPLWLHEGQGNSEWQTLPLSLSPNTEYELTGVIPCKGDLSAGQVVRVRF